MILKDALQQISDAACTGNPDVPILGIAYDSRSVQPGDLFVAIKGEKTDGAQFVQQAIAKGAAAVASEQTPAPNLPIPAVTVKDARQFLADIARIFYGDPCAHLKLVGITGTKGKTTTSYLIDSIYAHSGIASCLVGTIGMKIKDRNYHSAHTTPEASDLTRFFHQALEQGCTHGVLEVSSHALALKRVFGARFAVGIFMNLTHDHLDFHKEMESYFQAKKLLFALENGNRLETAVINIDDAFGARLARDITIPSLTFGFRDSASIHVVQWESRADSTCLTLETPQGRLQLHSRLIGRPNAYNIMAATGAAMGLGLDINQICAGIEALAGVPGRMERVDEGQDFLVLVDYAHSPDSLENLLQTAAQLPHNRLITVFGCGGDRDRAKRPIMGEIAARLSDYVIATSDNPRSEEPLAILGEIEPGLKKGSAPYAIEPDRRRAIEAAIEMASGNDVVLIAGKGHEDYQLVGGKTLSFDDRTVARELIRQRLEKVV